MFEYKGFTGDQEYSEDDDVYFGIIQNSADLVTYESDTPEGLEESFQEAVDDYLDIKSRMKSKKGDGFYRVILIILSIGFSIINFTHLTEYFFCGDLYEIFLHLSNAVLWCVITVLLIYYNIPRSSK